MNDNKKTIIYRSIMLVIITAIITFMVTTVGLYNYYTKNGNGKIQTLIKYVAISNESNDIAKKIEIVKEKLEKSSINDLKDKEMQEMAIKGYVAGMGDEYTEYLTKDEYEDLMVSVTGDYVGIGIYMVQDTEGNVIIILPIEDSPAEEAGLQTYDKIITINGEKCTEMDINEASSKIKGEEGTTVELEIERDGEIINKTITRRKVKLKTSKSEILEGNIGYIVLASFDEGCSQDIAKYLTEFEEKGVKSLILDLRSNTGGIVDEAIKTSEYFIPEGEIIMRSHDKDDKEIIVKSSNRNPIDMKVVVLVNENSASSTEIVTGALQDNEVATIVGTQTYGKGVMQEVQPLFQGALKVTTEEFFTPKGEKINDVGITPDIVIELDSKTNEDEQLQKAIELLK